MMALIASPTATTCRDTDLLLEPDEIVVVTKGDHADAWWQGYKQVPPARPTAAAAASASVCRVPARAGGAAHGGAGALSEPWRPVLPGSCCRPAATSLRTVPHEDGPDHLGLWLINMMDCPPT